MNILALDSSAKTAGVALLREDRLLYEGYLATGFTHSETLLQLVDSALTVCRLTPAEIDCYAVTSGPGSFTGLRIGLALVKGLAAAHDTPCVPVSTLHALAEGCPADGLILSAMDARRNEVYTALFRRENGVLRRLTEDGALPAAAAVQAVLDAADGQTLPVTLVGDGAQLCYALWPKERSALLPPEALRTRAAAAAAAIARQEAAAGNTVPAAKLRADYHRLCQAEKELRQKMDLLS